MMRPAAAIAQSCRAALRLWVLDMDAHVTSRFGALLRRNRLSAGMSQEALAERAGLSVDAVSLLERGRRTAPHPATVASLAQSLGLTGDERAALVAAASGAVAPTAPIEPTVVAHARPLPAPTASLVGRGDAVESLCRRLVQGSARLVTLTGPGGVGKTRLAQAVASAVQADYADGVVYVDLAPVRDPQLVAATIAQALGARETGDERFTERLVAHLRHRHVLLVLDNCEHVLEAVSLIGTLLDCCPRITILATSRTALQLRAEQRVPVPPLATLSESITATVEAVAASAATALFVARAQAVHPAFALTPENAPAVAAICRRLDGLPLAIELAAARTTVLSPQALLGRLDRRLALLTGGPRDLPDRQRTLRAVLDWSFDLLDPAEQRLFARLGVFAGGGSLDAVEHVCAAAGGLPLDALDGVASLLDKSLVYLAPDADEPRYALLETVREYAGERLASDEAEDRDVRRSHASYFLSLVEQADTGGGERSRLEQEQDNLRVALAWAVGSGDAELAMRLSLGLAPTWWSRGALREGYRWLEATLAIPGELPPVLKARGLTQAGTFASSQGEFEAATSHLEAALSMVRATESHVLTIECLAGLSSVAFRKGDLARARPLLEEVLAFQRQAGDERALAVTYNQLGNVTFQAGADEEARSYYESSLELARRHGLQLLLGGVLNNLGNLWLHRGDAVRAAELLEESVALRRAQGDKVGLPISLHSRGEAALQNGDLSSAVASLAESLALRRDLGDRRGVARCLESLAAVALARGDAREAARMLGAAEAMRETMGAAVWPSDRAGVDATARGVDAALGQSADSARAEGRALDPDRAVTDALATAGSWF